MKISHKTNIKKNKKFYVRSKTYFLSQYKNYEYRLNNVRLIWCKQVKEILKKKFRFTEKLKINDFGCGYFPFYKELKLSDLKHDYFGYDIDKDVLNLGLKKFPELKKRHLILNIESFKPLIRKADISVTSALLEHSYKPFQVLKYLLKHTKKCLILRTPISIKGSYNIIKQTKKNSPWIFNVFKKKDIEDILTKNNFKFNFHIDKASRKYQIGNNLVKNLKKKITIIEAEKNDNEIQKI